MPENKADAEVASRCSGVQGGVGMRRFVRWQLFVFLLIAVGMLASTSLGTSMYSVLFFPK